MASLMSLPPRHTSSNPLVLNRNGIVQFAPQQRRQRCQSCRGRHLLHPLHHSPPPVVDTSLRHLPMTERTLRIDAIPKCQSRLSIMNYDAAGKVEGWAYCIGHAPYLKPTERHNSEKAQSRSYILTFASLHLHRVRSSSSNSLGFGGK